MQKRVMYQIVSLLSMAWCLSGRTAAIVPSPLKRRARSARAPRAADAESAMILKIALIAATATATAAVSVDDAVAYVAKQAARTNSLHSVRTQYPDRVLDPKSAAPNALATWKLSHAPGSWTSGFWPGVNWHLAALTGDATWSKVSCRCRSWCTARAAAGAVLDSRSSRL